MKLFVHGWRRQTDPSRMACHRLHGPSTMPNAGPLSDRADETIETLAQAEFRSSQSLCLVFSDGSAGFKNCEKSNNLAQK